MNANKEMVRQLADSELYTKYEQAYSTVTGLPLAFRPLVTSDLPFQGKRRENAFCAMMARTSRSCTGCLQIQDKLRQGVQGKTVTATCVHGLSEAAVPVRLGAQTIGYMQTGQVLMQKPGLAKVKKVVAYALELGIAEKPRALREAYLKTPVLSREKFHSTLRLLATFAELLSIKSNQAAVTQSNDGPLAVRRAKFIIQNRYGENLTLGQVAQEVHVSVCYFCKLFRKATGMTFTEFVSRTRTERAKEMLLNPNLRVTEIAYEAGFQSLTHFGRVFKKLVGESPTSYRACIPVRLHASSPVRHRPGRKTRILSRLA